MRAGAIKLKAECCVEELGEQPWDKSSILLARKENI